MSPLLCDVLYQFKGTVSKDWGGRKWFHWINRLHLCFNLIPFHKKSYKNIHLLCGIAGHRHSGIQHFSPVRDQKNAGLLLFILVQASIVNFSPAPDRKDARQSRVPAVRIAEMRPRSTILQLRILRLRQLRPDPDTILNSIVKPEP
jgi:hypothetical protein